MGSRLEFYQKKLCSRKKFKPRLKPKSTKKFKELRLSQFLH